MDGVIRSTLCLMRSRWGRLFLLVVVCALPAGLEAALVHHVAGLGATTYIAPQASAVWPYGAFHDVRWVMVYHQSWAGFAGELMAAVVVRGLFYTLLSALAWPPHVERPSLRRLAARNVAFTAALAAFLSPWATMSVVVADVSLAWYLFSAIAPLLIMAPFLQRGAIMPNWWRGLPPAGIVVLSIVTSVTLTVGSALVASVPSSWRVAVAALAGGANSLLWNRAVRIAVLGDRVRWRRVPVTPIVLAVVIGLMFFVGSVAERGLERTPRGEPPSLADVESRAMHQPVIFLAGYNSQYSGERSGFTLPIVRYSYRGLHADGRPRPYSAVDTHQSLVTSARLLAAQIDMVHRVTGQKVALLAESEGTLITHYYLKTMPHQAVDAVVLLSPLLRAGRVYYPSRDRNAGWGVVTGWQLRGIFAALGAGSRVPDSADEPFIRSLVDNAPLFRDKQMLCRVSGVRIVAFVPTLDAITNPPRLKPDIPVIHVAGIHGLLIDHPITQRRLVEFLNERQSHSQRRWDYLALQNVGAAWQAPSLKVQLNPAWHTVAGRSTRNYDATGCL